MKQKRVPRHVFDYVLRNGRKLLADLPAESRDAPLSYAWEIVGRKDFMFWQRNGFGRDESFELGMITARLRRHHEGEVPQAPPEDMTRERAFARKLARAH